MISVIIPTFNRPQALHRAIASTLMQTLIPLEILVCEDGFSAETENTTASFNQPRVKWLPGPHAGCPAIPRNRGIQAAQGEWLAFLDDDDVWLPEKLEHQVKLAQTTSCRAICTNAWLVQKGKRQGYYFNELFKGKFSLSQLLRLNTVICSSALIHRSLLEKVKGFPESEELIAMEDYALWLRVAALTDFAYSPEPLLEYTDEPSQSIRRESITMQAQKRRVLHDFSVWTKNARLNSYSICRIGVNLFLHGGHALWLRSRRVFCDILKFLP
ncbi:MAG: glycosyltransferase family 2 protein [Chloroflexi bacterium]|nr:glycosyltransferase family 2 protein [Chloroflexota bacterium]